MAISEGYRIIWYDAEYKTHYVRTIAPLSKILVKACECINKYPTRGYRVVIQHGVLVNTPKPKWVWNNYGVVSRPRRDRDEYYIKLDKTGEGMEVNPKTGGLSTIPMY